MAANARQSMRRRAARSKRRPARRKTAKASTRGAAALTGRVRFTHPERVYWVDAGVTKQDLADYYRAVWDWMAAHVVGRVLSLVRCPEGTKGGGFFQQHAHAGLDIKQLRMIKDRNGKQIISIGDLDGLLSLVQAGALEVHVRGSTI